MTKKHDVPCIESGCAEHTDRWRQCPRPACKRDIGYCEAHGGDGRAEAAMKEHVESSCTT